MIAAIRIRNYKGIRDSPWLDLRRFHVLVGPNGSGKSTFLDAVEFLRSCVAVGPGRSVDERVPEFRDLTFMRRGGPIEIEMRLALDFPEGARDQFVYRVVLTGAARTGVRVAEERLTPVAPSGGTRRRRDLLGKTDTGKNFYQRQSSTYVDSFEFGSDQLALSYTPPDIKKYPIANRVRNFLAQGVRYIQLNSAAMRQPAAATRPIDLELDGTNLPRVVGDMVRANAAAKSKSREDSPLYRWTRHLRYALEDLEEIGWAARVPDNAEFLVLKFSGGLECPSWLLSDGTLRMLALTLPAFLPASEGLYMVEEPENGVHPHALEVIIRALEAIPSAQVFIATHSPLVIQQVGASPLLCFRRDDKRGVQVTPGYRHPALQEWDGTPDLGTIFASRVFG